MLAQPRDIRKGDTLLDTADRRVAYWVAAVDAPSIGLLTLRRFDPYDPQGTATTVVANTATLLGHLAAERLIVGGRVAA